MKTYIHKVKMKREREKKNIPVTMYVFCLSKRKLGVKRNSLHKKTPLSRTLDWHLSSSTMIETAKKQFILWQRSYHYQLRTDRKRFHLRSCFLSEGARGKRQINYRAEMDGRMRLLLAKGKVNTFHNNKQNICFLLSYQPKKKNDFLTRPRNVDHFN